MRRPISVVHRLAVHGLAEIAVQRRRLAQRPKRSRTGVLSLMLSCVEDASTTAVGGGGLRPS